MIKFYKKIKDFWTDDLDRYEFPAKSVLNRKRYNLHSNYEKPEYDLPQGFDEQLPECRKEFFTALNVEQGTVSWTCMRPGQIIPVHTDAFYKLKTQYNIDISQCRRYLVFLQDWDFGQMVEFEEVIITKWAKGDVWMFDHTSPHYAANCSNTDFITCQVNTFIMDENNNE